MVDVVVLPVVRIERPGRRRRRSLPSVFRPAVLPPAVTDINAFRYLRERAVVERRSSQSLLPDLGPPCDSGDSA